MNSLHPVVLPPSSKLVNAVPLVLWLGLHPAWATDLPQQLLQMSHSN